MKYFPACLTCGEQSPVKTSTMADCHLSLMSEHTTFPLLKHTRVCYLLWAGYNNDRDFHEQHTHTHTTQEMLKWHMKLLFQSWVSTSTVKYQSQTLVCSDIQLNSQWEAQRQHKHWTKQQLVSCGVHIHRGSVDLFKTENSLTFFWYSAWVKRKVTFIMFFTFHWIMFE